MVEKDKEVPAGALAVDRAIAVLESVAAQAPAGVSLAALSDELQVGKASVFRIAKALVARHALEYDEETETYSLGALLASLGYRYVNSLDLRQVARPLMEELAQISGETVHLGQLVGRNVVYVDVVDSPQPIRIFSRVGATAPAYLTSVGKAILAGLPAEAREAGLPLAYEPHTEFTVSSPEALEGQLLAARERGYAVDDRENREEIRSYAAPVLDHTGQPVAAVSVGGPVYRVSQADGERLGELVAASAAQISAGLGYRG
jgi:DNA-binding IclR family transcriptional regulator